MTITSSPLPAQSPRAVETDTMTFPEAIQAIIDGKTISKLEWSDAETFYGQLRNGTLQIHLADGWHTWIISDGDLAGLDWIVLD